jgi:hypothetical protein
MEQAPLLHSKGRLDKWRACARRQKRRAALPCNDLAEAARNDDPGLWMRLQ